jgi:hypothetical protein
MTESFNSDLMDALNEACQHIEWLTQHAKTSESGNALGVVINAKEFLARPDIHSMRVARAQIGMSQKIAAARRTGG